MEKCRTQSGCQVVNQEAFAPPNAFQGFPKDPKGIHVEENMTNSSMHEHVGHDLPGGEQRGLEIIHPQKSVQVHPSLLKNHGTKQHYHIDDNQVLGHRGCTAKSSTRKSIHLLFL
jgi:hypothetical protein